MKNHQQPQARPLGAHVSIAGGISLAPGRATAISASAIQIFTRNQRQWQAPPLAEEQVRKFRAQYRDSQIRFFCTHASYLCNLATEDPGLQKKSRQALLEELSRSNRLGASCLVLHPGSAREASREDALERVTVNLAWLLERTKGFKTGIALENTAGQGTAVGSNIDEISSLMERLDFHPRLGICLDTAHAFGAGIDLRNQVVARQWIEQLQKANLLERVWVLHLNDSLAPCGSRKDRHTHIGEGQIGESGFRNFLYLEQLRRISAIIETPKGNSEEEGIKWDRQNIARLRALEEPDFIKQS